MTPAAQPDKLPGALPFALSFLFVPIVFVAAKYGGWALLLPPVSAWWGISFIDALVSRNTDNPDPETPDSALFWHKLITWCWLPIQLVFVYGAIWYVSDATHLTGWEKVGVFIGVGILSGAVGIVYAHELLHQSDKLERWMADILLATVLYSHFRTEHLLVHHPWVGTPRDTVTARYNEGFHRYFFRVMRRGLPSAWRAEVAMLHRRELAAFDGANPFWRYWSLQLVALMLAIVFGGWVGLGLFLVQASTAIWQLELMNYVEHYGLTRKHLGNGKYEPVRPHHSWNADHRVSGWQLINLQRHSDHHYKPARRYPLLQTYPASEAPQLPFSYAFMGFVAMFPPVWRRWMNPKVREWRRFHYPEIDDWEPYKRGTTPMPGVR